MQHQSVDQFGPRLDDSLQFVVTSFRCRPADITSLRAPTLNQHVQAALAPKQWDCKPRSDPLPKEIGIPFLGIKRKPANKCFGLRLPNQMAFLGFVPQSMRIYVHDWKNDHPALRTNIRWGRRGLNLDHATTYELTDEYHWLYVHLQRFAWDVRGVWFPQQFNQGSILLDFCNKDPYLPPSRRSELTVDSNGILRIDGT